MTGSLLRHQLVCLLLKTGYFEYDGDLNKIRFIQQSMGVLNVVYYA